MRFVIIFTENGATNYRWHWTLESAQSERNSLKQKSSITGLKVFKLVEIH